MMADPYREPASELVVPRPGHELLSEVLRRLGLWRWRWVRRALGGRWEKFLLLLWQSDEDDDRRWIQEFWYDRDEHGRWSRPRSPPVSVGSWHRVMTWSVNIPDVSVIRVSVDGRCMHVGKMRFIEFLGSRLALVAYYREDW